MSKNILITGGTGMIGKHLSESLIHKGYNVSFLSRSPGTGSIKTFIWNAEKNYLEEEALKGIDYIIHLAGINVFDKKWTKEFKQEIIDSRVKSSNLLFSKLSKLPNKVKAFISASAIGIYGADTAEVLNTEETKPGKDFISEVVKKWESSVDQIETLNIRTVKIRIGIVLSPKGGALEKLVKPVKWGIVAPIGSGDQYISWIHIDDLCNIFIKSIENQNMVGVYNAVSPNPVTNLTLTKLLGKIFNKPLLFPAVPARVLKFTLGAEKAGLILGGLKVSSEKISKTGFKFAFPDIEHAIKTLIKSK